MPGIHDLPALDVDFTQDLRCQAWNLGVVTDSPFFWGGNCDESIVVLYEKGGCEILSDHGVHAKNQGNMCFTFLSSHFSVILSKS